MKKYNSHVGLFFTKNFTNPPDIIIYKHLNSWQASCKVYQWFNGKISACHAGAPGSIPGWCSHRNDLFYSRFLIASFFPALPFHNLISSIFYNNNSIYKVNIKYTRYKLNTRYTLTIIVN